MKQDLLSLALTYKEHLLRKVFWKAKKSDDHELQKRVIEAERSRRESKLWLIALISAIASVVSVSTAIVVVLIK